MDPLKNSHTDMPYEFWLNKFLPISFHPYIQLLRLDRPTGLWLCIFPALWSLLLSDIQDIFMLLYLTIFILIGGFLARSLGCVLNDLVDHKTDAQVQRTQERPLADGRISIVSALLVAMCLSALAILLILCLPYHTQLIVTGTVFMIVLYPFMKYFFSLPQIWLGLTFNMGVFIAWNMPLYPSISWEPYFLYLLCVLWTFGYDTIYAFQDQQDDEKLSIHSSARTLQEHGRSLILFAYSLFLGGLFFLAYIKQYHTLFFIFLGLAGILLLWQMITLKENSPHNCLARFKSNQYVGAMICIAFICQKILDIVTV